MEGNRDGTFARVTVTSLLHTFSLALCGLVRFSSSSLAQAPLEPRAGVLLALGVRAEVQQAFLGQPGQVLLRTTQPDGQKEENQRKETHTDVRTRTTFRELKRLQEGDIAVDEFPLTALH